MGGYPGWQFLAFLCLEKLPRWTYLARKCWIYSSSASLAWVEFYEWKFLSVPLSGCKLLRWCFLGGSSLQWSCSYLQFPFWNLRDLMASIFLQRNFLGGVSGWGILAGNSFLVFVLEPNPRWSFLGGTTMSASLSLFFAFRIIQTRLMRLSVVHGLNSSQKLKAIFGRLCQSRPPLEFNAGLTPAFLPGFLPAQLCVPALYTHHQFSTQILYWVGSSSCSRP